jgi:hypothetical protein
MTKQLNQLFKGADLHHSKTLIKYIQENAGSGGWIHIHSNYLTQLFKSSTTRQRCLKILIDNGVIEKGSHYLVGKSVKRYRIVDSTNPPPIQEEDVEDLNIPTIQEEEFFADQQVADLVVQQAEELTSQIKKEVMHYKYKNQVPELIRITDRDIKLYKEAKAWVEHEYFGFDSDAQLKRCLDLGIKELVIDFLIKRTLENITNGPVQQKV